MRYNLDKIDGFLQICKLPPLTRKQNAGVSYQAAPHVAASALAAIRQPGGNRYWASREERLDSVLDMLLQQPGHATVEQLARRLAVSRSTAVSDLNLLRRRLQQQQGVLLSSTRRGIQLGGAERHLRRMYAELVMKRLELFDDADQQTAALFRRGEKFSEPKFLTVFGDLDLHALECCLIEAERQLELTFSDQAFCALVIQLAIAGQRMRLGCNIIMAEQQLKSYETTKEFAAAAYIARQLEQLFAVEVCYDEIGDITILLLGSNVYAGASRQAGADWAILQVLTGQILDGVSDRLQQPGLLCDRHLFGGLLEHLRPAMYRLKNGLKLKNPVLQEIQNDFERLFTVVKQSVTPVEQHVGKFFSDEEIGYFTLHFGAALEKLKVGTDTVKKVLVVCNTGLGTARLLSSRLQQLFYVDIIAVVAYRQVGQSVAYQAAELVVATIPSKHGAVPWVQVHPLLLDEDIALLRRYLPERRLPPPNLVDEILAIVQRHCEIKQYDGLAADLAHVLQADHMVMRKGVVQPLLKDLLTSDMIALNVEATSWEEVICAGGKIMEDHGLIEHRYIDAMVATVRKMGPYIVLAKGIAMPHARPEDGAKKVGMALVTLKTPVAFGSPDNDPVSIAIFLCAVDDVMHLKALSSLMQLLEDEQFKAMADAAVSKHEIIEYIYNIERGCAL